jgi:hypothetical protein
MGHGKTREVGDGLLLIGLAVGVMSLMTIITRFAEHPASISSLIATPVTNRVAPAPSTTSRHHRGDQGARWPAPSDPLDGRARGRQGDARLDLRDAAAMAQWYLWARPGRGETRTDLWINAPASIGSTSPPDASPANHISEE